MTKAYFLAVIPAVVMLFGLAALSRPRSPRKLLSHLSILLLVAGAIAGWWYLRNYNLYGNISGMQELTLTSTLSFSERLRRVSQVPWLESLDSMLKQHIWIWNNSLLRLSRTMYRLGYFLIILSLLGIEAVLVIYVIAINILGYFCKALPFYAGFFIPRFHLQHFVEIYSPMNISLVLEHLSINKPIFVTPWVLGLSILAYFGLLILLLTAWFSPSIMRNSRKA